MFKFLWAKLFSSTLKVRTILGIYGVLGLLCTKYFREQVTKITSLTFKESEYTTQCSLMHFFKKNAFGFISKYRVWIGKCTAETGKLGIARIQFFVVHVLFKRKNLNKLLQMMGIMVFWDGKEETDYKEHEGRPHLYFTIVLSGKILAYLTTISDILSSQCNEDHCQIYF